MTDSTAGNEWYANKDEQFEEEYICIIRPADASFPHSGGSQMFHSLLSTASMVAHDMELRLSGRNEDSNHCNEERRGSPSGSSGSHGSNNSSAKPCSDFSKSTKNSTSSETGSEDNGEVEAD